MAIPSAFSFQKADLEEFFEQFGRIENIIIKEPKVIDPELRPKNVDKDKEKTRGYKNKEKEEELDSGNSNIAYIIYSQEFSAIIAVKVLQSVTDKEKIVDAKLCTIESSSNEDDAFNPMIGQYKPESFLIQADSVPWIIFRLNRSRPRLWATTTLGQSA